MIERLKRAWTRNPVLTSAFVLAILLTVFFAFRSTSFLIYWSDPEHLNQPVEGWMTPRYIVHSWQLSPEEVLRVIGEGPMPSKRQTLEDIATQRGIPLDDLIARLTKALEALRSDSK